MNRQSLMQFVEIWNRMRLVFDEKIFLCILIFACLSLFTETIAQEVLLDFQDENQLSLIQTNDVELAIGETGKLRVRSGHTIDWPGITLRPKNGHWDASSYQKLSFEIENTGEQSFEVGLRIDNPGADQNENKRITVMSYVQPGQSQTVTAALNLTPWRFSKPLKLVGMHAAPGQFAIDPTKINQVIIFLRQPKQDHQFSISDLRFHGDMKLIDSDDFLPFIDEYGQYIHEDWPGKTKSDADLIAQHNIELADLNLHTGPKEFNMYGGWNSLPMANAGKHFRVEKIDDKWWLIDPSGARFWSHGIDSVSSNYSSTGIDGRESYFKNLPAAGEIRSEFFLQSTWGIGFYESRIPYKMFNFYASNLSRKYGKSWKQKFAELAHKRLRSWGINTLACWSEPTICYQQNTPYTSFIKVEGCPELAGAQKMWTRFVDVYDPAFKKAVEASLKENAKAIGDPWCIGFFVDNELYWGEPHSLGLWALRSPSIQPAKNVLVDKLQQKYESIDKLNSIWNSNYSSWNDLVIQTNVPDVNAAKKDLEAFSIDFANRYFETVKSVLNERAPGQLYLGCRFIWDNPIALRAACKHCDVVSFNCYRYSPKSIRLPKGEDKPIIIGEFHFGALDRGMFHPTRVPAKDQTDRARLYEAFVTEALKHPQIVGTHWFQYASEATSGRGDGENYQIGFVDICDTPYIETIEAARRVGYRLYQLRSR